MLGRPQPLHGFTLIELLVVITIIVVLLSLLTPALDKAIYQAELAVCASQMHTTGTGLMTYAVEHRRQYPSRTGVFQYGKAGEGEWRPQQLYALDPEHDDRPVLRGCVDCDLLVDPLTEHIELDPDQTEFDSFTFSSYALWYGWRYVGEKEMRRLGDRFSYQDFRFNSLMADTDSQAEQSPWAQNSHPDHEGAMTPFVYQDDPQIGAEFAGFSAGLKFTISVWIIESTYQRPPVDRNVLHDDMSVSRYHRVEYDDARMAKIPLRPSTRNDTWEFLPR